MLLFGFVFFLEEVPVVNQLTGPKISQKAPDTPKSVTIPTPGYMNVSCNPGYVNSDEEEMGIEEAIV